MALKERRRAKTIEPVLTPAEELEAPLVEDAQLPDMIAAAAADLDESRLSALHARQQTMPHRIEAARRADLEERLIDARMEMARTGQALTAAEELVAQMTLAADVYGRQKTIAEERRGIAMTRHMTASQHLLRLQDEEQADG